MSIPGKGDIKKYAEKYTDFGFEMQTLRILEGAGFDVEHGGTYTDPLTKKNREFDIRASFYIEKHGCAIHLAVECKNIGESYPLVVQSVQRKSSEAFHSILHFPNGHQPYVARSQFHSLYSAGQSDWVAKSLDQISISKNGDILSNDGKTYDKMVQANNSAESMLQQILRDESAWSYRHIILPVLIVPEG